MNRNVDAYVALHREISRLEQHSTRADKPMLSRMHGDLRGLREGLTEHERSVAQLALQDGNETLRDGNEDKSTRRSVDQTIRASEAPKALRAPARRGELVRVGSTDWRCRCGLTYQATLDDRCPNCRCVSPSIPVVPGDVWSPYCSGKQYWACGCPHSCSWLQNACVACGMLRPEWIEWDPAKEPTAPQPTPAVGVKHDDGKLDFTLVPWDGLEPVVRVLMFGERKYTTPERPGRDNWRKVPNSTQRYRAALLRHVIAYVSGQETDPETGESHLASVVCCALFLLGKRELP